MTQICKFKCASVLCVACWPATNSHIHLSTSINSKWMVTVIILLQCHFFFLMETWGSCILIMAKFYDNMIFICYHFLWNWTSILYISHIYILYRVICGFCFCLKKAFIVPVLEQQNIWKKKIIIFCFTSFSFTKLDFSS